MAGSAESSQRGRGNGTALSWPPVLDSSPAPSETGPCTVPRGGSSFGSTMRWAVQVSNLRPPACKAGALPAELTAPSRPRVHPPPSMLLPRSLRLTPESKRETAEDHHGRAQRVRIFGGECSQPQVIRTTQSSPPGRSGSVFDIQGAGEVSGRPLRTGISGRRGRTHAQPPIRWHSRGSPRLAP